MKASLLLALTLGSTAFGGLVRRAGKVKYAGVNIAGCDFGINTSGSIGGSAECPADGDTQMKHFVNDDGLNIFRLPVGWQRLVSSPGGTLDEGFMPQYDKLLTACLATGALCIIDIHNYARWNGQVIGQGGPSNDQFAATWTALTKRYAMYDNSNNIVFGIMNEPHDLDVNQWATTAQAAVTAIRNGGAKDNIILLPGTGYTGAGTFPQQSGPALSGVKNPDGSTTGIVFDVHKYFDGDGSGTSTSCTGDNLISSVWAPLADYLRKNKRQAFLSETGGGNGNDCAATNGPICSALDYLNSNSDVYLGWTGWAAGSFGDSYELVETPQGGKDRPLVANCIAGKFK